MVRTPWDGSGYPTTRSWKILTLTRRAPIDREARFEPELLRKFVLDTRKAFGGFWRKTSWGRQVRDSLSGKKRARRDTSYVLGLEIAPGGMVHLHVAVYGEFLPQSSLQELWSRTVGELAFVDIRAVQGSGPQGIARALREVLKYATKGEQGTRDQPRRAAAVEYALREVHRISLGGAMRWVSPSEAPNTTIDADVADLHDAHVAACEACGVIGRWRYLGFVRPSLVEQNGGFGLVRRDTGTGPAPDGVVGSSPQNLGPVSPGMAV
jgi:hypothetical protein